MKRWTIKLLGITVGLILGWIVAGFLPADTKASEPLGDSLGHAAVSSGQSAHADAEHSSQTNLAALVPAASDAPWLKPVLIGVIGLFAAAVAIGIPSLKYQTPVSEPVASHDDHHASGAHGQSHDHHGQSKTH